MTDLPVNDSRSDPYQQFKFRVKWDGKYVAGVSHVSTLKRTTEVTLHREVSDPTLQRHSPGQTSFEPIILSRGVTQDPEFENWANKVWKTGGVPKNGPEDFRKEITLELFNETGQLVKAYKIYRCWPSEYIALSDLDAGSTTVGFESLTLQNDGWERDTSADS